MKSIFIRLVVATVLLAGSFYAFNAYIYYQKQAEPVRDFKHVTFWVGDEPVTLRDGNAQVKTALSGGEFSTIRYFGNEVPHDIDGDDAEDVVFLIAQDTAAGNEYFYAVGALRRGEEYVGTHAVLLGDKISPQSTNRGAGTLVVVNFTQDGDGTAQYPSFARSVHLKLDPQTLEFGEVVQNFEGESR